MYSKMIFPLPYWILMAPAVNFEFLHLAELQHSVISLYPYTERSDRVRIISARKMTPRERKAYEE